MLFTHYTEKPETVLKILTHGFGWIPNKRHLINSLLPEHDFDDREPQTFGMISFTELNPKKSEKHRKIYGDYGLIMKSAWCHSNDLRKVTYIKEKGFMFRVLKYQFKLGYEDLKSKIKYEDDAAWNMAYTNKNVALSVAGSKLWYDLLTFYEYVEPYKNKSAKEWRIVNPVPLYGFENSKEKIIKNIDPPTGWATMMNVLSFEPDNLKSFVCPKDKLEKFKNMLPEKYKEKEIITI